MQSINIVWFKRDLRIHDNAALTLAAENGATVLPLYVVEPELWQQPDMSRRHYEFLSESIVSLNNRPLAKSIHTPWTAPMLIGDYPMPIVDEKVARKYAADLVYGARKSKNHRTQAKKIVDKHGSRKSGVKAMVDRAKPVDNQQNLFDN